MTFSTIVSNVKNLSNVKNQDTLIKHAVQRGLDQALTEDLPYLMTDGVINTTAPHSTGNVDVTNGSKTVSGGATSPVFTAAMVGRKFQVDGDNAYYIIAAFVSATEITLQDAYQGDTDTDASYSVYKDEYRLPADTDTFKVFRQIEEGVAMVDIEATAFDLVEPTPTSQGSPNFTVLIGSKLDTNTTGTVSATVNTNVITGSSTTWSSLEGFSKGSRITIGTNVYTVLTVDSDTQVTTYEKIVATVSGSAHSILLDNLRIQFFQIPDAAESIYFRYQRIAFPLVDDEDIPDIPDNWAWILVHAGLMWAWAVKDREEAKNQESIWRVVLGEFWSKVAHVSRTRTYQRVSQDDLARLSLFSHSNLPSNVGLPI